jgi:hypothetical protein
MQDIELMHIIKKDQMASGDSQALSCRMTVLFIGSLKTQEPNRTRKKLTQQNTFSLNNPSEYLKKPYLPN